VLIVSNLINLFKSLDSSGSAEKEMDDFCLFLVLNEVRPGDRQMSCSTPTAQNSLSNVYLCPTFVPNRTNQAVGIVEASHGLVIFSAEPPLACRYSCEDFVGLRHGGIGSPGVRRAGEVE